MLYKRLLELFNRVDYVDRHTDSEHYFLFEKQEGQKLSEYLKSQGITLKGLNVLDLGCGYGGIIESVTDAKLKVGIDIDKNRISIAKKFSTAQIILSDGQKLCFKNSCFDLVIMNSVIEHIPNPKKILQEVKRVLKPSGIFYTSTCSIYSMWGGHMKPPLVNIPYFHLLPDWLIDRYIAHRLKKVSEPIKREFENSGYYSLNKMTIKRLMNLLEKTKLIPEHTNIQLSLLYNIPYINRFFRLTLKNTTLREFFSGEVVVLCKNKK